MIVERFRLQDGVVFQVSDETHFTQNAFVQQAIKKLGPIKGHARVLDKALWSLVVSIDDHSKMVQDDFVNNALYDIEQKSTSVSEFFRPCPLIRLPEGTDSLKIGRVAIDRTEARITEFQALNMQVRFEVGSGWSLAVNADAGSDSIRADLPPTMWCINLAAADPVREEEGLWLTDVALSILRMVVDQNDLGPLAPTIGKVEPHPFFPHDMQDHSFTLKQGGTSQLGGMTAPNDYWLTQGAVDALKNGDSEKKINEIFEAKSKTLAERFYQGCGWLTRGRRSKDRSDRLLYFFTAIEALLSDSDKTSPISQTISRHTAVLISDNNKSREEISNKVKKLYAVRSALVHAGSRGVYDTDVSLAQQIAEKIYHRVWKEIDLNLTHQEFSKRLGVASYGVPFNETKDI